MRKTTYRTNWALRIAAVLLCLVLYTTHWMGGLLARYITKSQASDNARVAKFNITETGTMSEYINFSTNPTSAAYGAKIKISNNSEVSMRYTVMVENLTDNIPLDITVTSGDNSGAASNVKTGILSPNMDSVDLQLNIGWDQNVINYNSFTYHSKVDEIVVKVTCEQID